MNKKKKKESEKEREQLFYSFICLQCKQAFSYIGQLLWVDGKANLYSKYQI